MRGVLVLLFLLAVLCSGLPPAAASPNSFRFALMGDAPYNEAEEVQFAAMLDEVNREDVAFVVHVGDIKSGVSRCTDEMFLQRREMFERSRHPFIYIPGDNEWTDCHRITNGGYDPRERLARLREVFYPDNRSLGERKLVLTRQSEDPRFAQYRENVRWVFGSVLFVGLNIPGSNNNLGREPEADQEYRERSRANGAWLRQAFRLAKRQDRAAVAVFIQANPRFERAGEPRSKNGYREFLEQLAQEARAFGRPVLLAHGDTHRFRVNRPLRDPKTGAPVENVLRVETFGSPSVDWVRITVDPASTEVFGVEPGSK